MITEERVEKAVEYFRDNKSKYGHLIGRCKALEHERKVVLEEQKLWFFKNSPEMRVAEVESRARTSQPYREALEDIENTWADRTELETYLEYGRMIYGLYKAHHQ